MIKHRSMWRQVLLFIITLGIYGIYRYCATFKEMVEHQGQEEKPSYGRYWPSYPLGAYSRSGNMEGWWKA